MALFNVKNIAILCNPLAGVGKAVDLAFRVQELLEQQAVRHELYRTEWPDSLEGFTDVFISGGDGTINYFVNHYRDCNIPITLFPGGTGNDLHWALYGNISTEAQLQQALQGEPRPVDAGSCNGKLFMNGLGVGFEGQVARDLTGKKKAPGKASFMRSVLKNILFYRSRVYFIRTATGAIEMKCLFISIMNGKRSGGGFKVSPGSVVDDGFLHCIRVKNLPPHLRLRYLPVIEKGKHLGLSFVTQDKLCALEISSHKEILYHLDGEFHAAGKLTVECLPGKFLFRY